MKTSAVSPSQAVPAQPVPSQAAPAGAWHRRVKGRSGWIVLGLIVIAALVFGGLRSSGPLTDEDRADDISQRLACPVCDGESVYESQSPAAASIRNQITTMIQSGSYTDDEIISVMSTKFEAQTQFIPKGSGFEALAWALPVVALVAAIVGLTIAFRRWKMAADTVPTDNDRLLVEAALREEAESTS